MSNRILKVLTVMVLGSLLVVACSKPADPPASPAASEGANEPRSLTASNAPAAAPENPRPQVPAQAPAQAPVKKTPAAKPAAAPPPPEPAPTAPVPVAVNPAPVPVAPAPAPVVIPDAPTPVPVVVVPVPAAPPAPTTRDVSIPSGTMVSLRMIDAVDSKTDHVGQTFKASLEAPVLVDGQTVIPKGADAFVKLTKVQSAGNLKGTSELQLQLDRVFVGNKSYTVTSNVFQTVGDSQGKKAVKQTGIGAGIGAVIGAIAGGKKGAAIGAGVGGGAGAATTAIQDSEQVRVEPEAKIVFRLEQSLSVTIPVRPSSR